MNDKRLTLSDDRMVWGVCGGLAEYFGIDPTLVRIAYVALTFGTAFSGCIVYVLLYWIIPSKDKIR